MQHLQRWVSQSAAFLFLTILTSTGLLGAVHPLAVSVDGSGSVLRNPDLAVYPQGSVVTITATPAAGSRFVSWTGDVVGAENPINVTMDADKSVTAHFRELEKYTLSLSLMNGGGILSIASGQFIEGTELVIQATPQAGWLFKEWSGAVASTANPLNYTVNSNAAIQARFVMLPQIVSQPQDVTIEAGGRAELMVTAQGEGPLSYEWYGKGAIISGASGNTLTLEGVSAEQDGEYYVKISSPIGSVQSRTAKLTVTTECAGPGVLSVCDEASLRTAVAQGGYIRFCCNGNIRLRSPLVVSKDVVLDAGDRSIILDGKGVVRLIEVRTGIRFNATNVVFQGGFHTGVPGTNGVSFGGIPGDEPVPGGIGAGGALYNDGGLVTLVKCTLQGNKTVGGIGSVDEIVGVPPRAGSRPGDGRGGAVYTQGGSLDLVDCRFIGNEARDGEQGAGSFGNPPLFAGGGFAMGGALYCTGNGQVRLKDVEFANSKASVHTYKLSVARGGAIFLESGSLELEGCEIQKSVAIGDAVPFLAFGLDSPAAAEGGAIFVHGGSLSMRQCRLTENLAQGSQAARHSGTGAARGGALFSSGEIFLHNCTLESNRALSGSYSSVNTDGLGGGLFNEGTGAIVGTTIARNEAEGGSASSFGSATPNYPPGHGMGGGVFNRGNLSITNSTIALNKAIGGQHVGHESLSGKALGGGFYNGTNGTLRLYSVTVASNVVLSPDNFGGDGHTGAMQGANLYNADASLLALRNSLVAYGGTNGNAFGIVTDGGYNMSSDASCQFASGTSFNLTDPLLLPLAANGGPTWTMALDVDSPAIDFGAASGAPGVDQRGEVRPYGGGFDIGAYERQFVIPTPLLQIMAKTSGIEIQYQSKPGLKYQLFHSSDLIAWKVVSESLPVRSPDGVEKVVVDRLQTGNHFFRVEVSPLPE